MTPLVLGTRGSPLAITQARLTMAALKRARPDRNFEIRIIKTLGDRLSKAPAPAGQELGKGVFTTELEQALFEKKIDLAVHSLKDLPTETTPGLTLAAMPRRADARDTLVTRGPTRLDELPAAAKVATGSPRRGAQLLLARRDLRITEIRGNIDTRLQKFREHESWSGLILAAAGLERLKPDLSGLVATPLPFETMLPAPGQGALVLQARTDAALSIDVAQAVHDHVTFAAVTAERMFLHALGGGCEEPVGAYAELDVDGLLLLRGIAWLLGEDTPRAGMLRGKVEDPARLGIDLAVAISR